MSATAVGGAVRLPVAWMILSAGGLALVALLPVRRWLIRRRAATVAGVGPYRQTSVLPDHDLRRDDLLADYAVLLLLATCGPLVVTLLFGVGR